MGNITQCPQCGTRFRVVPDQLKLSQGWVRCGHCSEVFEATACMVELAAPAPMPVEQPVSEIKAPAEVAPLPPEVAHVSPGRELREDDPPVTSTDTSDAPDTAILANETEVSFVRQARREAFWAQPRVRAAQAGVALCLALLLLVQVALHQRDWLAAAHPAWAPWLTAVCQPLGCQVGPLHRIESIRIDSSALVDLKEGRYRLEVTLNNTSALRLAMPSLELSLTNLRDDVVVRKPAPVTPVEKAADAIPQWAVDLKKSLEQRLDVVEASSNAPGANRTDKVEKAEKKDSTWSGIL